MISDKLRHIFGPVPSRRLGYSLGVDIMPFKTCTYDCIYCQLGRTTLKTAERKAYVPAEIVLRELENKLPLISRPDYITISGSGEPTLNSNIGDIIHKIKGITDIPVAVLTNGSLFYLEELRKSIFKADLVLPSLDAGNVKMFNTMNRPAPSIDFSLMVDGIFDFCREFSGQTWLEVFFVKGVNDSHQDLKDIIEKTRYINPSRIQLNTCDRPASEKGVLAASETWLKTIAPEFGGNTEIIAHFKNPPSMPSQLDKSISYEILNLIKRRPCRITDLSASTGIAPNQIIKTLDGMISSGEVSAEISENGVFYKYSGVQKS